MVERYSPESPRGKIARAAELKAGKEFGPERLKKADVARALNLSEGDISNEEWSYISEFAVNAGADLIQTAVSKDFPQTFRYQDVKDFTRRIGKNTDKLLPIHDIFHAAEMYHLSKGERASAAFAQVNPRERYTSPQTFIAELYPVLFQIVPSTKQPVPVMLASQEGRTALAKAFEGNDFAKVLLGPVPMNAEERKRDYEALVEAGLVEQAQQSLPDITEEEISKMREEFKKVTKNPPEHYAHFAARVFNEEWRDNPRLFLDELLECIRTKPK